MARFIEIQVKNKSLGEINNIKVYLTKELYHQLNNTKTQQVTMIDLFKQGRALRGFKHLIEAIRSKFKSAQIIFTHKETSRNGSQFFINYETYKQKTSGRFFTLYRETGIDGANYFLNESFPEDFIFDKSRISVSQLKKVEKQFPEIIKSLSKKTKNKKVLLQQTTSTIKELKTKERILKSEIDELERIQRESNIFIYRKGIEELNKRILKRPQYHETRGKSSWQNWIYENNWLFGIHYQTPIENQRVGFNNIPDYVFPTIDGFIDILEIKLPSHDVILRDGNHPGSYKWSGKTSEAIGQVVNYLHEIEMHQLELKQNIVRAYPDQYKSGIFSIKPRAFILIGLKDDWNEEKVEAHRKLNYSLHGIEVLTYSDLRIRGEHIIEMYNKKIQD